MSPEALDAVAHATIGRYFRARPEVLRGIDQNFARILGRPVGDPVVREASLAMVDEHSRFWIDFFHFTQRPPDFDELFPGAFVLWRVVAEALEAGKGAILLSAHFGNYELGAYVFERVNRPVHVVYIRDRSGVVERFRSRTRRNTHDIPVDGSPLSTLKVLRALSGGNLVAMQGDRDFNLAGTKVPFFGSEVSFPTGPWLVAAASGAPILPAFIVRRPDGRYDVVLEDPIRVPDSRPREAAIREPMARFVQILERRIRQTPTQWYCFYPFWDEPEKARLVSGPRRSPALLV